MASQWFDPHKDGDVIRSCVLVVAAFLSHVLTCGISYSYGVYYVTFLESFGHSAGITSGISSLNTGVLCAVGPLASYMIEKIGTRNTTIIGGVTSSAGLLIGAFSPNIAVLFLSIGIITGVGYGLVFTSCMVVIGISLTRNRTLGMGIAISGIGVGNSTYPFLADYLLELYGWRGAIIITSGVTLNICVFGMFMAGNQRLEGKDLTACGDFDELTDSNMRQLDAREPNAFLNTKGSCTSSIAGSRRSLKSNRSLRHISLGICKVRPYLTDVERAHSTELLYSVMGRSTSRMNLNRNGFTSLQSLSNSRHRLPVKSKADNMLCLSQNSHDAISCERQKCTAIPVISIKDGPTVKTSLEEAQASPSDSPDDEITLERLYAFKLPTYWLVQGNVVLFCLGLSTTLTHISAYVQYTGLSSKAGVTVLSVSGALNVVGRVFLGAVTQLPVVNPFLLYSGCLFVSAGAVFVVTVWTSFVGLLISTALFGAFSAAYGPVLAEVTVQVVGVENFNYSYGFLMIAMALGSTLGAPVAGWLHDLTMMYTSSFYFGGSCVLASALLMFPVAIAQRGPLDRRDTSVEVDV